MWYKPPQSRFIKFQKGLMEVAELKTLISNLEARVETIRDWL